VIVGIAQIVLGLSGGRPQVSRLRSKALTDTSLVGRAGTHKHYFLRFIPHVRLLLLSGLSPRRRQMTVCGVSKLSATNHSLFSKSPNFVQRDKHGKPYSVKHFHLGQEA
jgi:hypothetical protein